MHKIFLYFSARRTRENPRGRRACATHDGAICSKNRKIVPYLGDKASKRALRSTSPIMAPVIDHKNVKFYQSMFVVQPPRVTELLESSWE